MLKFRTNIRGWLFLIFGFIIAVSLVLTLFLNVIKNKIASKASLFIASQIRIQSIFFVFPNNFFLTRVTIIPKNSSFENPVLTVPLVTLQFSLSDFFLKRRFSISNIALNKPRGNRDPLIKFFKDNANSLITLMQELPQADIKFIIREARLNPASVGPESSVDSLIVHSYFSLKGRQFFGKGKTRRLLNRESLQWHFKGNLTSHGWLVNQFTLQSPKLKANFWGDLAEGVLQFNGYAFLKTQAISQPPIDIVDIDCQARTAFPKFQIEHLNFNLNGFPVRVKGTALFSEPPRLSILASVDNAPTGLNRIKNFKQAELNLSGVLTNGIFQTQGGLNFFFERTKKTDFPLEKIEAASPRILFYYDRNKNFTLESADAQILFSTIKNEHRVSFENIKTSLYLQGDKFKIIDLTAAAYNGDLQGRIWMDVSQFPMRISANADFSNLQADLLAEMLVYFSKIYGSLAGEINLQSHPGFILNGTTSIADGHLQDFDFFKWMAETFNIPSLTSIPFVDAQVQFWLSAQGSGLTDIQLNSKDVGLTGYFNVDKNNLVASKLSLALSRDILQESPKFRAILKMFEEDVPSLIFDFQLSGSQDAMNFQWLQSDFKQRIQNRIPNFMERMIDKKIDAILEGKLEETP